MLVSVPSQVARRLGILDPSSRHYSQQRAQHVRSRCSRQRVVSAQSTSASGRHSELASWSRRNCQRQCKTRQTATCRLSHRSCSLQKRSHSGRYWQCVSGTLKASAWQLMVLVKFLFVGYPWSQCPESQQSNQQCRKCPAIRRTCGPIGALDATVHCTSTMGTANGYHRHGR